MLDPSFSSLLKRSPPLIRQPATHRGIRAGRHRRPSYVAPSLVTGHGRGSAVGRGGDRGVLHHAFRPPLFTATAAPGSPSGRDVGFSSPGPELGLLYVALAFSMITISFFTMVVISLPIMGSMKKLSIAMEKLSNVASREVSGTLLSLKLSAMEINGLTLQLSSLRRVLSGIRGPEKEERMNRRPIRGGDDSLIV